jgi:geranylgeranyl diphosphate synthase type II
MAEPPLGAWLALRLPRVEQALEAALPARGAWPEPLARAMRHLVFPGGKRLRPALALAAAEAVGADASAALPMAVAVELVHTYSLIHDDLPCMDDDELRRGKPTVHVAYGEARAVLAGDALQALAFEVLLAAPGLDAAAAREAAHELARAAGARGLVGGQVDDLDFDPASADAKSVESVHARKTAALFVAAVVGGARLGGADTAAVRRLREFAERLGGAFQIADDALDQDEDDACSYVRVAGAAGARERAEALFDEALAALESFGPPADPLRALARLCVWRSE